MNNQAGKGPEIRKGANLNAYWENYDAIFRKPKMIIPARVGVEDDNIIYYDNDNNIIPLNQVHLPVGPDDEYIDRNSNERIPLVRGDYSNT